VNYTDGRTNRTNIRLWSTGGAMLALFILWMIQYLFRTLGHDQISYLLEADRFLSGNEIYGPHLSETNPPLIIWFSALPVSLAHPLQCSAISAFRILVDAMILGSVAWCVSLLRRSGRWNDLFGLLIAGFAIATVEMGIGPYDFGQREHLLVILLTPYLLATATGTERSSSFMERCALGIAAGLAIWFKPQDVLIVLAATSFCALRERSLRRLVSVELVSLILTACVLFLFVRSFTPLYLTRTVPLLLEVYWALGSYSFLSLLLSSKIYIFCVFFTLLVCIRLRSVLRDWTTPFALLLCSLAAYIACAMQHTMWAYHKYPHRALLYLAAAYLTIDLIGPFLQKAYEEKSAWPWIKLSGLSTLALLCLLFILHPHPHLNGAKSPGTKKLDAFLDGVRPGTTVSILSTSVLPLASAYNHQLVWGSRFAHLWMLPAIIQNERGRTSPSSPFKQLPVATTAALAELQRKETAEDLNYWTPALVLIARCTTNDPCQGIEGKDVDLLSWFQRSSEFSDAWRTYEAQPSIDGFDVYRSVR